MTTKKNAVQLALPSSKTEFLFNKLKLIDSSNGVGSTESQIILLSARIGYISEHLKVHPKDHSSRRGLLKLVGQRKRLLRYLERTNISKYNQLKRDLGIR